MITLLVPLQWWERQRCVQWETLQRRADGRHSGEWVENGGWSDLLYKITLFSSPMTVCTHRCITLFFKVRPLPIFSFTLKLYFCCYSYACNCNYVTRLSVAAGRRVQSEQSGYTAHHTRGHSDQALPWIVSAIAPLWPVSNTWLVSKGLCKRILFRTC